MNFKTCSNTKTTFFSGLLKKNLETKCRTKKSLFVGHADRQTLSHCSEQAFVHCSLSYSLVNTLKTLLFFGARYFNFNFKELVLSAKKKLDRSHLRL